MHYLDTSVIAALILGDPESASVEAALEKIENQTFCLSLWTGVEIFSAISRRVRMRQIGTKAAERARQLYLIEFQSKHLLLPITVLDFDQARNRLQNDGTGLRAGDALHLAIAINRQAQSLWTLDKVLRKAARAAKIDAPAL